MYDGRMPMRKEYDTESLKNTMGVILMLIGDIGVVSDMVQKESSISGLTIATGLFFAGFFWQIYVNQQQVQRWRGLSLLAKRGHIQTLRMILLRDYLKKHPDEEKQGDVTVTNDFVAEKAEFNFMVGKNHDGCSDITYKHKFIVKRKWKKKAKCCLWIFGDDDVKPYDCTLSVDHVKTDSPIQKVNGSFADYPINDGIYAVKVGRLDFSEGNKKLIELSYKRERGYKWERDEVFVIYPQCFARECERADFTVEYCQNVQTRLSVCLTEVVCMVGSARLENEQLLIKEDAMNGKKRFFINNIHINANNVYILKISHLDENQ